MGFPHVRSDKMKQAKTTGDGRPRLRLLFITEQNVARQTC